MQIKSLEFNNFRNYENLFIEFAPGINIIYGENAQGKTNILEGIYMCGLGKSHRHSKENEIIRLKETQAHIKGEFFKDTFPLRIDIHLKKNGSKGIAVNRIPIKKLSELYGNVNVVIFSPEDLDLIKRGPLVRRTFVNQELCQIDPIYVNDLINYSKILNQRHELLKKMDEDRSRTQELLETLDIWDLQLAQYGTRIIERRTSFLEEMNDIIFESLEIISVIVSTLNYLSHHLQKLHKFHSDFLYPFSLLYYRFNPYIVVLLQILYNYLLYPISEMEFFSK